MIYTHTCQRCGRVVATSRKYFACACTGPPGLGDRLAVIVDACGGRLYKRLYRWIFNRECGCGKRKAKINKLGERISTWLKKQR